MVQKKLPQIHVKEIKFGTWAPEDVAHGPDGISRTQPTAVVCFSTTDFSPNGKESTDVIIEIKDSGMTVSDALGCARKELHDLFVSLSTSLEDKN